MSKDDIAVGQAQLKAHFDVLAAGDDATLKVLKSVVDARKGTATRRCRPRAMHC